MNAGYVTIQEVISDKKKKYTLVIPSEEVQEEFQGLTADIAKYY